MKSLSGKIIIVSAILLLTCLACPSYAAPVHDLCQNAISIAESEVYSGKSKGATGSSVSNCSVNDTADVWHSFSPSENGNYTISLCGSSFDTTLSVYDACGGIEIACNDDICSVNSQAVANLTAGETYLIRVAGYNGATGDYLLQASKRPEPPVNDEMSGAVEVFESVPCPGDTSGATGNTFSSCAQSYDFYDVWHEFIPAVTTEYSVSLCNSSFDTTLAVHDAQGMEIGCNDDSCGSQSKQDITLTGGQTYYIRIAGFDGATGSYQLNVTRIDQVPLNDLCVDAIEVFLDSALYGTSVGATGTATSSCSSNDKLDVWHYFTPSQTGYHTVSLCGSSFDTTLTISETCGGSELACNDNVCDTQSEAVAFLTAGQSYLIRIAGKNSKTGDYVVRVSERFTQPGNDQCVDAIEVYENISYHGNTTGAISDTGSSCGYNFDLYDVWHSFTPAESKDYLVSLCGSDFDTTLSVYDACMGTELACNDDSCDSQSALVITLTAGETYQIRVAGYDGDMGNYSLNIIESVPPPVNDDCQDFISLQTNVPYSGSTIGATGIAVSTCSDTDSLDVWFSYTPIESGIYHIDLCGSQFDTTLSIYDSCGGTQLACNDDYCQQQSQISLQLDAGAIYMIRVAGYRGAMGSYTLIVSSDCSLVTEPITPYPNEFSYDIEQNLVLAWNSGHTIQQNIPSSMPILKGIYGSDDRKDEYQVTDAQLKAIGDSTVALIPTGELTDNGDGTWSIPTTSLADTYLADNGRPLCSDEPFIDQPDAANCTGFLVAPNLVATTGHCVSDSSDCSSMAFVFGFTMLNSSTPVTTFDDSDVYFCAEIVARLQTTDSDWALIRLDREVLNHAPLVTRRTGKISDSQDLAVIGHTIGLPRKYADNAWVQDNLPTQNFYANLDTFIGNSGSPVINMNTYEVEGMLFAGNSDFVSDGDCDRSAQCLDGGCPSWERATRTTEFSDLVPVFDVYLGTSPDDMQLICSDTPKPWCSTSQLNCGTNYYWQVVAKSSCGQRSSDIWVFSTALAGDYDHDCDVDMSDYALLASQWMNIACDSTNNFCQGKDIDMLGTVDLNDLAILVNHWLDKI